MSTINFLKNLLYMAVLLFCIAGCASEIYINKNYNFQRDNGVSENSVSFVLIPVSAYIPFDPDTLFTDMFSEPSGSYKLIKPSDIRKRIAAEPLLGKIIQTIDNIEPQLRNTESDAVNLDTILTDEQFMMLRQKINDADVLILPARFIIKQYENIVYGRTLLRLFDLNTGELIFEKQYSFNVAPGGHVQKVELPSSAQAGTFADKKSIAEIKKCISLLAESAADDFKKLFMKKFK